MHLPSAVQPPGQRLKLGDAIATLDRGGVFIAQWPNADSMASRIAALGQFDAPRVRLAGGALIGDLSLQDNLMLEPALDDGVLPPDMLPSGALPEIDALFGRAGCAIDWPGWAAVLAHEATPLAAMQVRVGRALVADADVLLVDADHWDDALLPAAKFSRSFSAQYPWRVLAWATCDPARAAGLRDSLQELLH